MSVLNEAQWAAERREKLPRRTAVTAQAVGLLAVIAGVVLLVAVYAGALPATAAGLLLGGTVTALWGVLREAGRL